MKPYLLILLIHGALSNQICELIQSQKEKILAIGELQHDILIVTQSYNVGRVPKSTLTKDSFDLRELKYRPIEEAFPAFKGDSKFDSIKSIVRRALIHTLRDTEYFEMLPLESDNTSGLFYYIQKNRILPGRRYVSSGLYFTIITLYNANSMYGFAKYENNFEVSYWQYNENGTEFYRYFISKITKHFLCQNEESEHLEIYVGEVCKKYVDWAHKRGFISQDIIYLLDEKEVIIFPKFVLNNAEIANFILEPEKPYRVTVKSYGSFFKCHADLNYTTHNGSDRPIVRKSASLVLIAVLSSLFIILLVCLSLGTYVVAAKRRREQKRIDARSSLNSVFGQLTRIEAAKSSCSKMQFNRSSNMPMPGVLSKLNSARSSSMAAPVPLSKMSSERKLRNIKSANMGSMRSALLIAKSRRSKNW